MESQGYRDGKQVHCLICLKTFSTHKNLQNHNMTIHEMVFPFKCTFSNCTKAYSIESRLKVHMRTHCGKKPFKCLQCGKAFCEKGNLKTHVKFHSSKKPFSCDQCDKSYKTKGHLKDHIEVQHNGYKKYLCSLCQKSFGRSSTLKAHTRTHTGEKSIKCRIEECNQYFAEKGNMEMHYKRHLVRIQKGQGKFTDDSANSQLKRSINITRPCSNVTLLTEGDFSNKKMFVVNKGNINDVSNNDVTVISPKYLIDSTDLVQFVDNSSEDITSQIDNSFTFCFPNLTL